LAVARADHRDGLPLGAFSKLIQLGLCGEHHNENSSCGITEISTLPSRHACRMVVCFLWGRTEFRYFGTFVDPADD